MKCELESRIAGEVTLTDGEASREEKSQQMGEGS
jgi:hypothetical protein